MQQQTKMLGLPYILPSQAQKHVPHNEALHILDAAVQLVLESIENSPPSPAIDGACYGVGSAPTGAWIANAGGVAQWRSGAWNFLAPKKGWLAWCASAQRLYVHDGLEWGQFDKIGPLYSLGIGGTADETNRLAVASAASLFSHDGADHRLKINKSSPADTASLIFQTDWTGHAEIGLTGSNTFSIKVPNAEGDWQTALQIDPTGHVATPLRPSARAWFAGGIVSLTSGDLIGFTDIDPATGGFSLGPPFPTGRGGPLVASATAHYLVCMSMVTVSGSCQLNLAINGDRKVLGTMSLPGTPSRKYCVSCIVQLAQGDWVAMSYTGGGALDFGFDKTELSIAALT